MTNVRTLRESKAGLITMWKNWPATRTLAELGLHGAGAAALAAGVTAQGAEFRTTVIEALIGLGLGPSEEAALIRIARGFTGGEHERQRGGEEQKSVHRR
jgi:hypothetical protein